jgi:hypothetical protein
VAVKLPSFSNNLILAKGADREVESLRVMWALADMGRLRNKLGLLYKYISALYPLCNSLLKVPRGQLGQSFLESQKSFMTATACFVKEQELVL